jgi:thiamine biosynthesis lipoprotein
MTGGAFDMTVGPVVELYGLKGGEPALPTGGQLAGALEKVGWEKVLLDRADTTVTLTGGAQIDLAGIGKGYAVDRSVEILRGRGIRSALVNLGGNIYAIGTPPRREGWTIGIRDPESRDGIVGKLTICEEGVATSGNYENFVVIGEKRYGHIIDPRSGTTVDSVLGVTVISRTAMAADALSTALFVMGPEESARLALKEPTIRAVFALPGDSFRFIGEFSERFER